MNEIGVTERGDAALDLGWLSWVKEGKPAILITKDPNKLLDELLFQETAPVLNGGIPGKFNAIIHTTITGFGGTVLEPNVREYKDSLWAYKRLVAMYGIDRVVLRIDPVIPTDSGLRVAKAVLKENEPGGRVRISFIDQYPHTKARLKKAGVPLPWSTFHAPIELRKIAYEELGRPEICGEPDFTYTGCVSELDCRTLKVDPMKTSGAQRKFCACLVNKKELLHFKHPCENGCLYCYWRN